jgi:hypothetical protein
VIHRDFRIAVEIVLLGNQLDDFDAIERPAMRRGSGRQLFLRLRKRDVEALLARLNAFEQEL